MAYSPYDNTVSENSRIGKKLPLRTRILKAVFFLMLLFGLFHAFTPTLPTCDEPEILDLTKQLIKNAPDLAGVQFSIDKVLFSAQISYDEKANRRICAADVYFQENTKTTITQLPFQYLLRWEARMSGRYVLVLTELGS
jgi:hypothetical protein